MVFTIEYLTETEERETYCFNSPKPSAVLLHFQDFFSEISTRIVSGPNFFIFPCLCCFSYISLFSLCLSFETVYVLQDLYCVFQAFPTKVKERDQGALYPDKVLGVIINTCSP